MDPPDPWGCVLHLARRGQDRNPGDDPLLNRGPGCLRHHLWHHPVHFQKVPGNYLRAHQRWRELRIRADPVDLLHELKLLHGYQPFTHGGDDRLLHPPCETGSLPTVGEHVPSSFQGHCQVDRGVLLMLGVE